jgi:hypothetical protein
MLNSPVTSATRLRLYESAIVPVLCFREEFIAPRLSTFATQSDRTGNARAWADRRTGWVADLAGRVFALVAWDGVFDRAGAQIGWCGDGYIQHRLGRVVLFTGRRIEHLTMPQRQKIPRPPRVQLPSAHPTLRWLLMPPRKNRLWGDFAAFYDGPGPSGKAVGRLRGFQERAGRR